MILPCFHVVTDSEDLDEEEVRNKQQIYFKLFGFQFELFMEIKSDIGK